MALLLALPTLHAAPPPVAPASSPSTLLREADRVMAMNRPRFTQLLDQLHQASNRLTPEQAQHLQLLDAIHADMAGHSAEAVRQYSDILDHPVHPLIEIRARAALITLYLQQRQYIKAYALANKLIGKLPDIDDRRVRQVALKILIRVLDSEKQYDQAIDYANQLEALTHRDEIRCEAGVFRTQDMLQRNDAYDLAAENVNRTIAVCRKAGMLDFSNSLRLDWAERITEEGHPARAIAYLDRIRASVMRSGFRPHIATLEIFLARAYMAEGKFDIARQHARAALAACDQKGHSWMLEASYRALYRIEKHDGDFQRALDMHEKFMEQHQASEDQARAEAMAYQIVKQDVLAKRLKVDKLGKQNRILLLRQSLDRKSAETSRLYIVLLLLILAFIGFWAYRIKHSQVRFRRLARHDGLTGACNRQHFFEQAEAILQRLQRSGQPACLLILDMDHFKRINDVHGHACGDMVLQHVIRICRDYARPSDIIGRLGGEEFGILMPDCDGTLAMETGERIRHALALSPVRIRHAETLTVTASIGLACSDLHGHALKPLLVAADHALYAAKRGGRNRVVRSQQPSPQAGA